MIEDFFNFPKRKLNTISKLNHRIAGKIFFEIGGNSRFLLIGINFYHDFDTANCRLLCKTNNFFPNGTTRNRAMKQRFCDFNTFFWGFDFEVIHLFKAFSKRNEIYILDFKPSTSVDFEQFWTIFGNHPVQRQIPQPCVELNLRRIQQNIVPKRHNRAFEVLISIWEFFFKAFFILEKTHHLTIRDIEPKTNSSLREICLSARRFRRHAYHRSDRYIIVHNHTNISESMTTKF